MANATATKTVAAMPGVTLVNLYAKIRAEFSTLDAKTQAAANADHTVRWFVYDGDKARAKTPADTNSAAPVQGWVCKCGLATGPVRPVERLHEASLLHRWEAANGTAFLVGTPLAGAALPAVPAAPTGRAAKGSGRVGDPRA